MKTIKNCKFCQVTFTVENKEINRGNGQFCSLSCSTASFRSRQGHGNIRTTCSNCSVVFSKAKSQCKSQNNFCSRSCAVTYNNKHKTHGNRRSKLEKWLEEQLTVLYPDLEIHFNKKDAIGSELDIYIPSLRLAFELNGIFHYEPIYGSVKLGQIQNNDISKSKLCHDAQIDLCVIDTSAQKYVKPKTSQKYLDIITSIINEQLTNS